MPRLLSAITIVSALSLGACEAKPPAAAAQGSEPVARKSEPSKTNAGKTDASKPAVTLSAEPASAEPPPPPAWFDANKIPHQAVVKQMQSQGTMAGGHVSALILELEPGVSNEQCIERAKTALGESLSELPEATVDGDRLMLQGKTDDYHYTVVCGEAKGKPTIYLSYTAAR